MQKGAERGVPLSAAFPAQTGAHPSVAPYHMMNMGVRVGLYETEIYASSRVFGGGRLPVFHGSRSQDAGDDQDDDSPFQQGLIHPLLKQFFVGDHLGGGPSEHSPAEVNDDRETVRQFDEQTASPDDDRHADQKPEDDQDEASVSRAGHRQQDRKSTRLNSSHVKNSYAVL